MPDIAGLNRSVQLASSRMDWLEYLGAHMACLANGRTFDALPEFVRHKSPRLKEIIQQKSTINPATVADASFAAPLAPYRVLSDGFIQSVSLYSSFDRIFPDMVRVPMRTKIAVASTAAHGSTVSEATSKPVCSMAFSLPVLEATKVSAIAAITDELARFANGPAIARLNDELARSVGLATDTAFLAGLASSAGSTKLSSGSTTATFVADLAHALDMLVIGANAKVYLIVGADACKRLATLFLLGGSPTAALSIGGGTLAGVRVVVSDAASDTGYLVDASQLAADADPIVLDASNEASIQLDTAPATPPTNVVSLWMQNMTGIRADRYVAAQLLRNSACSLITGMTTTA